MGNEIGVNVTSGEKKVSSKNSPSVILVFPVRYAINTILDYI